MKSVYVVYFMAVTGERGEMSPYISGVFEEWSKVQSTYKELVPNMIPTCRTIGVKFRDNGIQYFACLAPVE